MSQQTMKRQEEDWGVAQVVQHLPSKYKAWNSNPRTKTKQTKNRRKNLSIHYQVSQSRKGKRR
jgi:hypothetical protein